MQKREIKLSKKTKTIITWWVFIEIILLVGIIGLSTMGTKSLTRNDYKEIEIIYGHITTTSGEDPMYTIFPKNDEKGFLIDNIVSSTLDKTQFNEQVSSSDIIILTVLKSDYESKITRIETLGVRNGNTVFMDFDRAFNKRISNGLWGHYMALILLPLAGILAVVFLIWLLLYNKGIIGIT